jgi:hypothetical protein
MQINTIHVKKIQWKATSEQLTENTSLASGMNEGTLEAENFVEATKQVIEMQERSFGKFKKVTIVLTEVE